VRRHRPKLASVVPIPAPLPPRPQLTLSEVEQLEAVIRNGLLVAGYLTARGQLSFAGGVDALTRTIRYLQGKFQQPPKPAAPPAPPADPGAKKEG
jgi:hypothetical protein